MPIDLSSHRLEACFALGAAVLVAIWRLWRFKSVARSMTFTDRIEMDPKIMMGKPVIRGSRIPVELLLRKLGAAAAASGPGSGPNASRFSFTARALRPIGRVHAQQFLRRLAVSGSPQPERLVACKGA